MPHVDLEESQREASLARRVDTTTRPPRFCLQATAWFLSATTTDRPRPAGETADRSCVGGRRRTISLSPSKRRKEEGRKGFALPFSLPSPLLLIFAVPPFAVGSIGPEKNERRRKFRRDKTVVMERGGAGALPRQSGNISRTKPSQSIPERTLSSPDLAPLHEIVSLATAG